MCAYNKERQREKNRHEQSDNSRRKTC
jgi:hypothetical protein